MQGLPVVAAMASSANVQPENLRRTRSEGSAPGLDTPRAGPVRIRVSRRTGSPVGRAPPTLPPLDLPRGPLMPSLHSAPPARGPPPTWDVPLFDEPRRVPPAPPPDQNAENEGADGLFGMLMESLGYAGPNAKARRELLSLIFSLTFGFAQVRLCSPFLYMTYRLTRLRNRSSLSLRCWRIPLITKAPRYPERLNGRLAKDLSGHGTHYG